MYIMENFPANQEIWMSVDGYINYEVSSFGRVRNAKTGRVLKQHLGSRGYFTVSLHKDGKPHTTNVHRMVGMAFLENPNNYPCIDHIDRNPLNNHKSNLRYVSHSLNNQNRKVKEGSTSQYFGVLWNRFKNKWDAKITFKRKCYNLGYFLNEEDAARAYDKKAIELHGPEARLNFP